MRRFFRWYTNDRRVILVWIGYTALFFLWSQFWGDRLDITISGMALVFWIQELFVFDAKKNAKMWKDMALELAYTNLFKD